MMFLQLVFRNHFQICNGNWYCLNELKQNSFILTLMKKLLRKDIALDDLINNIKQLNFSIIVYLTLI